VNQALDHFVQKEELHGFTHQDTKKEVKNIYLIFEISFYVNKSQLVVK
jgi:hypothetical protein